ncbi:MAG TPA: type II toxin-antitoxin system death-on-curing family toxin [Actinocatenispora sp.]
MTRYLSLATVLAGAEVILGPAPGVRDVGLLDSAIGRPAASAFGADAYPTIWEKAAALLHSIVSGHPFVDGNMRMGWAACVVFLELNGEELHHTEDDAFELVMAVAAGELADVPKIAERLEGFCR